MCDFTSGFRVPEMVKRRPVIVIASGSRRRTELVTVVPLSTSVPDPVEAHHRLIDSKLLPKHKLFFQKESWLKGDLVNTVGFPRLSPIVLGRERGGKRIHHTACLSRETMREVYCCVLAGLNLGELAQHLQGHSGVG